MLLIRQGYQLLSNIQPTTKTLISTAEIKLKDTKYQIVEQS